MSALVLDAPRFGQGHAVAAISRHAPTTLRLGPVAVMAGAKDPRVVLIHDGRQTLCLRIPDGRALDPVKVEAMLPGALAEVAAAWARHYVPEAAAIISD